jgi:hypothetical protein
VPTSKGRKTVGFSKTGGFAERASNLGLDCARGTSCQIVPRTLACLLLRKRRMKLAGVSVILSVSCLTACSSDQAARVGADAGSGGSVSRASGGKGGAGGSTGGSGGRVANGGAGGNEDAGAPDSGGDGEAPVTYDCIGGKVARAEVDSGPDANLLPIDLVIVPWTRSVGTCDVGTTYCYIQSRQYVRDALPVLTCGAVPAACTATPDCACFCSHGLPCQYVNCSCKDDANGRAIFACDQI